jgi:hypothetical protein
MIAAITIRVFLALTASGARNAETPVGDGLDPGERVVPETKARRTRNMVTTPTATTYT